MDWWEHKRNVSLLQSLLRTCFPVLRYHSAVEGKTSQPARRAAWAAAHWCGLCWWAPSPPPHAPPPAAHPASLSPHPLWMFPPLAFRDKHTHYRNIQSLVLKIIWVLSWVNHSHTQATSPAIFEFLKAWVNSLQPQDPLWTCKSHVIDDFILMVFIKPKFSLHRDKEQENNDNI